MKRKKKTWMGALGLFFIALALTFSCGDENGEKEASDGADVCRTVCGHINDCGYGSRMTIHSMEECLYLCNGFDGVQECSQTSSCEELGECLGVVDEKDDEPGPSCAQDGESCMHALCCEGLWTVEQYEQDRWGMRLTDCTCMEDLPFDPPF